MCGVGWVWWGGVGFKDVVAGHVEHTWHICVGWGGMWWGVVGRLKKLLLVTLSTRGTYVWGGVGCGVVWWGGAFKDVWSRSAHVVHMCGVGWGVVG